MIAVTAFVDPGLGHSSYLVDLGDGRALVVDPARIPDAQVAHAVRAVSRSRSPPTPTPTPTTSPGVPSSRHKARHSSRQPARTSKRPTVP